MKQHFVLGLLGLCLFVFVLPMVTIRAAAQDAKPNFAGTWLMTMASGGARGRGGSGGGNGGGGGNNGGGENRRGGGGQSLTVAQNGDAFKVTHHTPRGDNTYDATVSANSISWTEDREGRGNAMKIDFKATVDGETMTGTMGAGQLTREFTAKRSN
jgi:hypothetical protein